MSFIEVVVGGVVISVVVASVVVVVVLVVVVIFVGFGLRVGFLVVFFPFFFPFILAVVFIVTGEAVVVVVVVVEVVVVIGLIVDVVVFDFLVILVGGLLLVTGVQSGLSLNSLWTLGAVVEHWTLLTVEYSWVRSKGKLWLTVIQVTRPKTAKESIIQINSFLERDDSIECGCSNGSKLFSEVP